MCSHPRPSFPWSLDFLTPGFGPWFVVLHPVNYVAENWKLLGMWVSMRWPQDMHSLSCVLSAAGQGNWSWWELWEQGQDLWLHPHPFKSQFSFSGAVHILSWFVLAVLLAVI